MNLSHIASLKRLVLRWWGYNKNIDSDLCRFTKSVLSKNTYFFALVSGRWFATIPRPDLDSCFNCTEHVYYANKLGENGDGSLLLKNLKPEDGLPISKIRYFQPILANCRVDITIFILYMGLYWMEPVVAWCRISSGPICCYPSPDVTQPYQPWFFAWSALKKRILIFYSH